MNDHNDTVGTRKCSNCHEVLPLEDFYLHKGMPRGRTYTCKSCNKTSSTIKSMKSRGAKRLQREIDRDLELISFKQRAILELEDE